MKTEQYAEVRHRDGEASTGASGRPNVLSRLWPIVSARTFRLELSWKVSTLARKLVRLKPEMIPSTLERKFSAGKKPTATPMAKAIDRPTAPAATPIQAQTNMLM